MMIKGEKLLRGILMKLRGLNLTQAGLIVLLAVSSVVMGTAMMHREPIGTALSLIAALTLGMLLSISLKGGEHNDKGTIGDIS